MFKLRQFLYMLSMLLLLACGKPQSNPSAIQPPQVSLQQKVDSICNSAAADIGVFIISPDGDSVMVHPDKPYRMMSVAKFPQALKLLHMIQNGQLPQDFIFRVTEADMKQRTFSTLPKDHPTAPFSLTVKEVLGYSVGQSDNVTSNLMFEVVGGPLEVDDSTERLIADIARVAYDYYIVK